VIVPLLVAAALFWPIAESPPPKTPESDPAELVDALLSGLLGFREATEPELQKEVVEVGGVPFKEEVPLQYLTRESLSHYLEELFDAEYPEEQAEVDRRTLVAFDLMQEGTDLRGLRARVLRENIVGFYDERPGKKRLRLVSDNHRLTPMNQIVLSHELRHALQDQYVEVHALVPESVGDYDDRRLAVMSLLEGDATFVMERFLLARLAGAGLESSSGVSSLFGSGENAAAQIPDAPAVVRDQLVLPYFIGRDFVDALYGRGGWEAVKAAWARPPASMEQVLHPEKYEAGEAPRAVEVGGAPPGWRLLREGVLGEALVRTLLGPGSEQAAAGWGGDAYRVYDRSGRTLLVWRSVWDSALDLREFLAAARSRFARAAGPPRDGRGLFSRERWQFVLIERAGGAELLSSDDPAVLEAALRARTATTPPVSGVTASAPAP
jgi:hypothetical protein